MERTLLIIKPDAYEHAEEIIETVKSKGFNVIQTKFTTLNLNQASELYEEHEGKDFYERLVRFMTGSFLAAVVVEGEHGVMALRDLVGDTDPEKAAEGTLRKAYGKGMPNNAVHASANLQSADREIRLLFGS